MHTGAEIAVELLHFVALLVFGVEGAEVGMFDLHIVKIEIVNQFIIREMFQIFDNFGMFSGMRFIPLCIGHSLFSACG